MMKNTVLVIKSLSFIYLTAVMGNKGNKKAITKFDDTEKDNLKEICRGSWFTGPVYDNAGQICKYSSYFLITEQFRA